MDILFLLVPFSALLVLGILAIFAWALHSGQFDDLEQQGREILAADSAPLDEHQGPSRRADEESLPSSWNAKNGGSE
jgi:cbb3-type cytochrome oxidase maturation protein